MKYIIYMDVFFVVNLTMDFLLLKLAAFYIKPHTTYVRCVAGGAAGSLITCLSLLLSYEQIIVHMLISYIFTVAAMVFIAYGKCTVKQMIRRCMWLYFVTVFMGGAMNMVYNYTYFGYMLQGIFTSVFKNPISLFTMSAITCVSYLVMRVLLMLFSKRKKEKSLVRVMITIKGKTTEVKGLIDSGNSLMDPYYKKPVHIVEYDALQRILEGVDIHKEKYRLVPFHSLGKKNGLVEVIESDEIVVYDVNLEGNGEENLMYREEKPAIGLYHSKFSAGGEFEMLLHGSVGQM